MIWKVMQNKEGVAVDPNHVVAVENGGGIRASIASGDITKKDIHTVLPVGNTVYVIYLSGAELLEALEASYQSCPVALGGFSQISGMEVTIDTTKAYKPNAQTYPNSTYYGPRKITRVTINSVNGKPFNKNDIYAVVTNDFLPQGGDTYYAFAAATNKFDTGMALDEALMEYITEELGGVVGGKYAGQQGRITIIK